MTLKFEHKKWFVFIISILLITNLTILLDIPFLRQSFGFLFLTLLPGLLILPILKLNKIDFLEKFILAWGLSISFLMFYGLLINNSLFNLGYKTPLTTISLLVSFNIAFIVLTAIRYKVNKESSFSLPNLNLNMNEKAFLIVPVLFPALSIFGMHVMNTTDNNIILMFLLFSIPTYVIFVCFFNQKFPKRLYPIVIFLIGISLLLLLSLRSNHILGCDTHKEYYLFQTALDNLHWRILTMGNQLDACLSISILPTVYQSILNINPEFLFKILYSLLYSISPLVIYVLSKKYVGELYGFLASCFFMFQSSFLVTEAWARISIAILFYALAMMVLFNDKIAPLKRRVLFIVFMASCVVSHYSTTYIFFFILLGTFIGIEVLSKKYTFKNIVSLTIVLLFFAMIFFWYSQVTETAFVHGVSVIEGTLKNLHEFFVVESRTEDVSLMFGKGIMEKGIPHKIKFVFTWLTFALIGIGVITLIRRYKEMSFPELDFKKSDFLREKFEVEYVVVTLACSGLLVAMIVSPYISQRYDIFRVYAIVTTLLSPFFVVGGIIISKNLSFIKQTFKKNLIKNFSFKKETLLKKQTEGRRGEIRNGRENSSQVWVCIVILLVLIPYFLCSTGVIYQIFGVPQMIILNSEGENYDKLFVHDQESCGAKWLKEYNKDKMRIYTTDAYVGTLRLTSQGNIPSSSIDNSALQKDRKIKGYIYLGYYNVVEGKLFGAKRISYNLSDYSHQFVGKSKIYANGGSEVYL